VRKATATKSSTVWLPTGGETGPNYLKTLVGAAGIEPATYGLEEHHNPNSQVVGRTTDSPAILSRQANYPHALRHVEMYRHVPKCVQNPHKSPHSQPSYANPNFLKIRAPGRVRRRPDHRSRLGHHRVDSPLLIHTYVGVGAPRWRQRRRDAPESSASLGEGLDQSPGLPRNPTHSEFHYCLDNRDALNPLVEHGRLFEMHEQMLSRAHNAHLHPLRFGGTKKPSRTVEGVNTPGTTGVAVELGSWACDRSSRRLSTPGVGCQYVCADFSAQEQDFR